MLKQGSVMKSHQILLYYCYAPIEDAEAYREAHHLFCIENNIRGRIIIADEGLNGTVTGLKEDCKAYMDYIKSDPRFKKTEFKIEASDGHAFQKINVRYKSEIVHSGFSHIDPNQKTGIHLEPDAFKKMMHDEDVILLDCRSNYEHEVGRFKGAVTMDIDNFRDIPSKLDEIKKYKDKKVITYCTGGIKCEKASGYLLEQGFEQVYQLHGGIIKYGIEEGGEDFDGKCYVFDNRVVADVNKVNPKVVSQCYVCQESSDRMVNCANPTCNIHVAICEACGNELEGACSETCKNDPNKRPYSGNGAYPKELNGYNPYKGVKWTE